MTQKISTFITSIVIIIGVVLHGVHIEKLNDIHVKSSSDGVHGLHFTTDPHVHPDKPAHGLHGFTHVTTLIAPRDKRFKNAVNINNKYSGRHAFDDLAMPIVA